MVILSFKAWLIFILVLVSQLALGQSRPVHDDVTPGILAVRYGKSSNLWTRLDLFGVDGNITTSPPDRVRYDRKAQTFLNTGVDQAFSRFGLRFNFKAWGSLEKEEEAEPPKSPIEKTIAVMEPSLDVTFINPQGLEIFGGMLVHMQRGYTEKLSNELVSLESKFDATQIQVPRFGMMRRGGNWAGGFYFVNGVEVVRSFEKSSSDGSFFRANSVVHIPTEYGIIAKFVVEGVDMLLDLGAVQAGEGGERSVEGVTVKDDYQRLRLEGMYNLGAYSLKLSLGYRTFSYSSNAFMTVDTIPMGFYKLLMRWGDQRYGTEMGLLYVSGRDGLSIPETNEEYEVQGLGFTISSFLPL